MTAGNVRIKVKSGQSEAEVEADLAQLNEVIKLIPEILSLLPGPKEAGRAGPTPFNSESGPQASSSSVPAQLPSVSIDRQDSLGDILVKFFSDQWGRSPRRLSDVREVLQSYGLSYPKQSVAVALLRLAKASKLRRFKSEGGEFVYTTSTSFAGPRAEPIDEQAPIAGSVANV